MDQGAVRREIEARGFAVVRGAVDGAMIRRMVAVCPAVPSAGLRDLLQASPPFGALADAVSGLAASVLGGPAFVTRAILFDKSPDAN